MRTTDGGWNRMTLAEHKEAVRESDCQQMDVRKAIMFALDRVGKLEAENEALRARLALVEPARAIRVREETP